MHCHDHGHGALGLREDRQRAVAFALRPWQTTAVLVHEFRDDLAQPAHRALHGFRVSLPLRCRLFDIGQTERQLAGREVGLVRVAEPFDQLSGRGGPTAGVRVEPSSQCTLGHLHQRGIHALPAAGVANITHTGEQRERRCRKAVDVGGRRRRSAGRDLGSEPRTDRSVACRARHAGVDEGHPTIVGYHEVGWAHCAVRERRLLAPEVVQDLGGLGEPSLHR